MNRVLFIETGCCIIWELVKTALLWLWKTDLLNFVNTLFVGRLTPPGVSICQATVNAQNGKRPWQVGAQPGLPLQTDVCACRSQANLKTV